LLVRKSTTDDRRAKLLELMPEGSRIVRKAFVHYAAVSESTMKVLDQSEKKRLHALLKKLGLFAQDKKYSQ
jgi:DNA-binding MarR family transcriptional regulator